MKTLISDSGGMKTYIEIRHLDEPHSMYYFRISTSLDNVRRPDDDKTRLDLCLKQDEFAILKKIINFI